MPQHADAGPFSIYHRIIISLPKLRRKWIYIHGIFSDVAPDASDATPLDPAILPLPIVLHTDSQACIVAVELP